MTLRVPICGKCGKESCNHKQPGWGQMWWNGEIVSMETRQPVRRGRQREESSKRLGSELEKLHKLYLSGALTQVEFDAAKKKLIGN